MLRQIFLQLSWPLQWPSGLPIVHACSVGLPMTFSPIATVYYKKVPIKIIEFRCFNHFHDHVCKTKHCSIQTTSTNSWKNVHVQSQTGVSGCWRRQCSEVVDASKQLHYITKSNAKHRILWCKEHRLDFRAVEKSSLEWCFSVWHSDLKVGVCWWKENLQTALHTWSWRIPVWLQCDKGKVWRKGGLWCGVVSQELGSATRFQ